MSVPAPDPDAPDPDAKVARGRLVDHFKRAFQIVVSLAIANACGKLFLDQHDQLGPIAFGVQFWMFAAFLVTVVPIFHGGDRSLDIKYFAVAPTPWQRAAYVVDVYLLLVTAIFFVKIAQALPKIDETAAIPPEAANGFYRWMGYMLGFDIIVLATDWLKSRWLRQQGAGALAVYRWWACFNVVLAALCAWVAYGGFGDRLWASILVFAVALIRTVLDYAVGGRFLFP